MAEAINFIDEVAARTMEKASRHGADGLRVWETGRSRGGWKDIVSLEFESKRQLGGVQLWSSGECDAQVVETATGDTLLTVTGQFRRPEAAARAVEALLDLVANGSNPDQAPAVRSFWDPPLDE